MVFGWPKENEAIWRDRIEVKKEGGKARGKAAGVGVWAETKMRVRKKFQRKCGPMALLELRPTTGRTHQLRIQCANRGMPIVGDRTYGDFTKNRNSKAESLFLHSEAIELPLGAGSFKSYVAEPKCFKLFY